MKRTLCIFFILCLLLLCGCQKPIENKKSLEFFPEGESKIRFNANGFEGSGKIFFDTEGKFHLLHSDKTSPLFGLEEVYSGEKAEYYFQDQFRSEAFRSEGTALIYSAIDLIASSSPKKRENTIFEEKEAVIYTFSSEDKTATLYLSKADHSPLQILGQGALSGLSVQFLPFEQN